MSTPDPTRKLARRIVDDVMRELDDRSGFDHWWDYLDDDIQREIKATLRRVVAARLNESAEAS